MLSTFALLSSATALVSAKQVMVCGKRSGGLMVKKSKKCNPTRPSH
ncbi:hypothetical protein LRS06_16535 [Hymenobacter sp. J193]|nr:hypothetical protein [Hymenobacter sp. J193]MCR5889344.1 hypothetical protein [Hymenobacter sp. J193]